MTDAQRQSGLRSRQRLNPAFFIATQHRCLVRWGQVEPDNIPEFMFKLRVVRQVKGTRVIRTPSLAFHNLGTVVEETPKARLCFDRSSVARQCGFCDLLQDAADSVSRQRRLASATWFTNQFVESMQLETSAQGSGCRARKSIHSHHCKLASKIILQTHWKPLKRIFSA